MGNIPSAPVSIAQIPFSSSTEAAYAAYACPSSSPTGRTRNLARVAVLNMNGYNSTVGGEGLVPLPRAEVVPRPSKNYTFALGPASAGRTAVVRRLWANGSDAITGITWDGWSYNFELDEGRPVRLGNVTVGETVEVGRDGAVTVSVPDSSAARVELWMRSQRLRERHGVEHVPHRLRPF